MMRWLRALLPAVVSSRVALVPEGWRLVREKPTEAHIESMCMRFDHSHGIKHSFPVEESDAHFESRRNFNRTMVLQLYEEAVGLGFHKIDSAEAQKEGSNMLEMFTDHDWMRADDYRMMADGIKYAGHSKVIESPAPPAPELEFANPELADCTLKNGIYFYPCRSCGESTEVYEPQKFDPMMHYCGRSPRCCP